MHEHDEEIYRMCLKRLIIGGPVSVASCRNGDGRIPHVYLEMMVREGDAEIYRENDREYYRATVGTTEKA